jgi:N-acetyl-gamma-glutamyl-phosphate reductase
MKIFKIGIINITGYAGIELARLLIQHPQVELVSVTGRSSAGKRLDNVFPHIIGTNLVIGTDLGDVDLVFSAMPHKESTTKILPLLKRGIKVVDLSADFRLKNAEEYRKWYGFTHPAPQILGQAEYGLSELHRRQIASAKLVANPGCYPTGSILALAPAIQQGLIGNHIIIDSKSGISGAGRTLKLNVHFAEANEGITAYALDGHRHLPEIIQELNLLCSGQEVSITFVPHLIPMTRGILTTCYAPLVGDFPTNKIGEAELKQIYHNYYKDEPFIKVTTSPPNTKHTQGSNQCLIFPTIDIKGGRLIVISCIDNLVKGAAGQAIQNMNLMLGLPEITGLEAMAVYP